MHIFIDESGSFTGFDAGSISVVGAVVVPDSAMPRLLKKYARMRPGLGQHEGEVKGRLLNEQQVDKVATLLMRNEAIFFATVLDLGVHDENAVGEYKQALGDQMLAKVPNFREDVRAEVKGAAEYIHQAPTNLFLQALTTFTVLHRIITQTHGYFAQRKPYELGSFAWVVDGKEQAKVTRWEEWLAHYAQGALATMSKRAPVYVLPEQFHADYSFFDKFNAVDDEPEQGTSLKKLLEDITFSSTVQPGLEFVDILTNATRRSLIGNLQREGWQNIHRLMLHENGSPYLSFVVFHEGQDIIQNAAYADTVREGFSSDGRLVLTKRNIQIAMANGNSRPVIAV